MIVAELGRKRNLIRPHREGYLLHRCGDACIGPAGDLCSNSTDEDLAFLVPKFCAKKRNFGSNCTFKGSIEKLNSIAGEGDLDTRACRDRWS